MDALAVMIPFPYNELHTALRGMSRQHRGVEVRKDAVVSGQALRFQRRSVFHHGHVLAGGVSDVHHLFQCRLYAQHIHNVLPVENASLAGNAAEVRVVPAHGQVLIFDAPDLEAVSPQIDGCFFKVPELHHTVLTVHFDSSS